MSTTTILDNYLVKTSDGQEISLKQAHHHFQRKIAHLPKKEQVILEIKYTRWRKALGHHAQAHITNPLTGEKWTDLLHAKEYDLIELFGRMFSIEQATKIVNEEWGIKASEKAVNKIWLKHKQTIVEKIEVHKKDHLALRLSHKKSRIEELGELYEPLKEKYKADPRPNTLSALVQLIDVIRRETDGDIVQNVLDFNVDNVVKEHFAREIVKSINIKKIVLTRIAAKANINIDVLNFSLDRSYYKKINEVQNPLDEEYEILDDFKYPSDEQYDIRELEPQYKELEAKKKDIEKDFHDINTSGEQLDFIKQKLLKKLSEEQEKVEEKRNIMNAIANAKKIQNNNNQSKAR